MIRAFCFIVVALVSAGLADVAWACSCGGPVTSCNAYRTSDVVFVGDVVEVGTKEVDEYSSSVQIRVVRPGKGGFETGQLLTLRVPDQRSTCGMGFEPGQRWFIFGSHGPAGPRTSFCQHSHRLSPTDRLPDLPARGGVVNGWFGRPGAPGGLVDGPSDVPVWIDTPLGRIATRTTDGGSFSLAGVPPGVWTVAFAVGPDLRARAVIELEPTDDCFGVRAWARFAGGLSGTVVDEAGVPVVGAPITAILTTDPDGIYQFHGETGDTGQFLIDALDPGPYVVRVGKEGEENGQVPYRPLFYPAAQERAEAKAIDVGARVVRLDPIVMRAPLPTVTLAVDIVCRDGTRPPRAYVTADRMDGEGIRNYASPQGTGGHHTVRVLARYRYRVGGTVFVTRKGRDGSPAPSLVETSALEVDTAAQPSLVRLRADLDGCDAPGGPWIGVR